MDLLELVRPQSSGVAVAMVPPARHHPHWACLLPEPWVVPGCQADPVASQRIQLREGDRGIKGSVAADLAPSSGFQCIHYCPFAFHHPVSD